MKKTVRNIGICLAVAVFVFAGVLLCGNVVHASGLVDDTVDIKHLFSKYPLKNYCLDFYVSTSGGWLPWNWGDNIGKSVMYGLYCMSNLFWIVSVYISSATGYVVQEAYKLDFINDMISKIGKNIQELAGIEENGISSSGLYAKLLLVVIIIVGIYMVYVGLIKKETSRAMHTFLNFVLVFVFSAAFIAYAPEYMKMLNEFSSDLSTEILNAGTSILNTESDEEDSVVLIRDSLFVMQIEKPWLLLQYGTTDKESIGEERVEKLLSVSPSLNGGEDRENVVKSEIDEQNNMNLTITEVAPRLGMVLFIFFLNIIISIFVFLLTGIMVLSQILFLIFSLVLVISFLVSMIPGQENQWKRAIVNLFNTLMARVGITLIITLAFCISNMFYTMSDSYPFALMMFLQIVTFAGIFMKMNDILGVMNLSANDSSQLGRKILNKSYRQVRMGKRMGRKMVRKMVPQNSQRHMPKNTTEHTNKNKNVRSNTSGSKQAAKNASSANKKEVRKNVAGKNNGVIFVKSEDAVKKQGAAQKQAYAAQEAYMLFKQQGTSGKGQKPSPPHQVQNNARQIIVEQKGTETSLGSKNVKKDIMRPNYVMTDKREEQVKKLKQPDVVLRESREMPKRINVNRQQQKEQMLRGDKNFRKNVLTDENKGRKGDVLGQNLVTVKPETDYISYSVGKNISNRPTSDVRNLNRNIHKNGNPQNDIQMGGVNTEKGVAMEVRKNATVTLNGNRNGNLHSTVVRKNVNMQVGRKTPAVKSASNSLKKERVRKKADEKN